MSGSADRGAAAVELVLVTPLLVLFLLFIVFTGRVVIATGDVNDAARASARAASLARDPGLAAHDAEVTARDALDRSDVPCRGLQVTADVTRFTPGGTVEVTLSCDMPLGDLGLLGLGAARRVTAHQVAVIDRYRGAP